jgi:hypothetical protein
MILAYSLVIGCSLMHIFCCGIPFLATIAGLGTTITFIDNGVLEGPLFENFEKFEVNILFLSGVVLLTAFILKLKSKKLSCCDKEEKNFCQTNEKINSMLLNISFGLYLFNITTLVIDKMI